MTRVWSRSAGVAMPIGAEEAGHEVRMIDVAALDFPLLRKAADWQEGEPPAAIREAQATVAWAEHLVLLFPLWLGDMPALLKGFLEQLLRPGFAFTMGMPAFFYRLFFQAHSVASLRRNVLGFCGIAPVRTTYVGMIEGAKDARRKDWLDEMATLGRSAR